MPPRLVDVLPRDVGCRPEQQRLRDGKPKRLGGVAIDEHTELSRAADRNVSGSRTVQDLDDLVGHVPEECAGVDRVGDETDLGGWKHPEVVHHGQATRGGELNDVVTVRPRRAITEREECADAQGDRVVERLRQIFALLPFCAMEPQAGFQCCGLDVGPVPLPVRRRSVEHADAREARDQFLQHVEPPRRRFRREIDCARCVAPGSVERGDLRRAALISLLRTTSEIVAWSFLTARMAGPQGATITSSCEPTRSSAISGYFVMFPSAQRYVINVLPLLT